MFDHEARVIAAQESQHRISNIADIEQARVNIKKAYTNLFACMKANADALPLSDEQKRWVDPELNGLEDTFNDAMSTLDKAEQLEREQ